MKYEQPFGEADPNASYKDRNTGAGQPGSRVPAKAIENPQREIQEVIEQAGLTPSSADVTQLYQAILVLIGQITGEGENPLNDLLDLLRARLPIFPEIVTSDGRFNLSAPSTGVVRIPAGIQLRHRGCFNETTAEQDFNTTANKTYHLRKRWTGGSPGWALVDLSDAGYNPSALAEGSAAFDTGFDDMISHRVTTNASNIAAIKPLKNKAVLTRSAILTGTNVRDASLNGSRYDFLDEVDWGRMPETFSFVPVYVGGANSGVPAGVAADIHVAPLTSGLPAGLAGFDLNRYRISQTVMYDYTDALQMHFSARA